MNYFPSPPTSPSLTSFSFQHHDDHVICGACDKALGADWFCSNCHSKCNTCNRFLGQDEYCSRCWSFDSVNQQFYRKLKYHYPPPPTSSFTGIPSPSNSTGSLSTTSQNEPKLLTRSFTYKF